MFSMLYSNKRVAGLIVTFMTFLVAVSPLAQSETIFEGYYKLLINGEHSGFFIQRFDFMPDKKEYRSTYYIQAVASGGSLIESLQARSNDKFQPIEYKYTVKRNELTQTVDAQFDGQNITATVSDGKSKSRTVKKRVPDKAKDYFLSTFLAYMLHTSEYKAGKPAGLKVGKKNDFYAIAEEELEIYEGQIWNKEKVTTKGVETYKLYVKFKGSQYISYLNDQAQVIKTEDPVQSVATELVAKPTEATSGFKVPTQTLKTLFGRIPTGTKNVLSQAAKKQPKQLATPSSGEGK